MSHKNISELCVFSGEQVLFRGDGKDTALQYVRTATLLVYCDKLNGHSVRIHVLCTKNMDLMLEY